MSNEKISQLFAQLKSKIEQGTLKIDKLQKRELGLKKSQFSGMGGTPTEAEATAPALGTDAQVKDVGAGVNQSVFSILTGLKTGPKVTLAQSESSLKKDTVALGSEKGNLNPTVAKAPLTHSLGQDLDSSVDLGTHEQIANKLGGFKPDLVTGQPAKVGPIKPAATIPGAGGPRIAMSGVALGSEPQQVPHPAIQEIHNEISNKPEISSALGPIPKKRELGSPKAESPILRQAKFAPATIAIPKKKSGAYASDWSDDKTKVGEDKNETRATNILKRSDPLEKTLESQQSGLTTQAGGTSAKAKLGGKAGAFKLPKPKGLAQVSAKPPQPPGQATLAMSEDFKKTDEEFEKLKSQPGGKLSKPCKK